MKLATRAHSGAFPVAVDHDIYLCLGSDALAFVEAGLGGGAFGRALERHPGPRPAGGTCTAGREEPSFSYVRFCVCGGDLMAAESWIETVHEPLPAWEAPGNGVFDDALSERLELRGGLFFVRCFACDLVEFGVDEATQLVGGLACGSFCFSGLSVYFDAASEP